MTATAIKLTDRQRAALIADKQMVYDETRLKAKAASDRAMEAENLAAVARQHARKMGEAQNAALRELVAAQAT